VIPTLTAVAPAEDVDENDADEDEELEDPQEEQENGKFIHYVKTFFPERKCDLSNTLLLELPVR